MNSDKTNICARDASAFEIAFNKVGSEEHLSYYSVFDGHAGTDAACYAASHLHELLVASQHYPEDPVQVSGNTTLSRFILLETRRTQLNSKH